jgi:hypothetical protein
MEIRIPRIRVGFLRNVSLYRRNQDCQTSESNTQAAVKGFAIKASLNQEVSVFASMRCSSVTVWFTGLELDKVVVLKLDCIAIMTE